MSLLSLNALTVRRGGKTVLHGVSAEIAPGDCVGLIGPNGAGKTTLLRAALGLLPHEGSSSLSLMPPGARARAAAWLPQSREVAWPVSTADLVALGRLPWGGRDPDGAVNRAMERMGIAAFADRPATALSGGEQARVLIARALAQDTPLLLADEAVAGLDPAAQIRTMRVFAELAAEGRAVIASVHDLGLALRHCTRLLILDRGRLVADGPPMEVLAPTLLADTFGLRARIVDTPDGPVFQAIGTT